MLAKPAKKVQAKAFRAGPRHEWQRGVRNDRGESWPSMSATARALNVSFWTFRYYVGTGRIFDNTLWHYVTPSPEKERAA